MRKAPGVLARQGLAHLPQRSDPGRRHPGPGPAHEPQDRAQGHQVHARHRRGECLRRPGRGLRTGDQVGLKTTSDTRPTAVRFRLIVGRRADLQDLGLDDRVQVAGRPITSNGLDHLFVRSPPRCQRLHKPCRSLASASPGPACAIGIPWRVRSRRCLAWLGSVQRCRPGSARRLALRAMAASQTQVFDGRACRLPVQLTPGLGRTLTTDSRGPRRPRWRRLPVIRLPAGRIPDSSATPVACLQCDQFLTARSCRRR